MRYGSIMVATITFGIVAGFVGLARAGTLENMERERSILLEAYLAPDLTPAERQAKAEMSRRRLIDLERLVIRDNSLVGRNTPTVRRAFDNYDATFLLHAATEKNASVLDLWLEQVGITTQTLMAAKHGRR